MTTLEPAQISGTNGAIWGTETDDLNATLVRWDKGLGVDEHTNHEVDVIMTVIEGEGEAFIDGRTVALRQGTVVVIPKGAKRKIAANAEGLTYLNVHTRRRKLMPTGVRPPRL